MKRLFSLVVVVIAILALANMASAQIVPPPVDNTDLKKAQAAQPAAPPQVEPPAAPTQPAVAEQPAPKPTPIPEVKPATPPLPPPSSPTAPRPEPKVQAPRTEQPPAERPTSGVNYTTVRAILLALTGVGIVVLLYRRLRESRRPADEPSAEPVEPPRPEPAGRTFIPARPEPPAPLPTTTTAVRPATANPVVPPPVTPPAAPTPKPLVPTPVVAPTPMVPPAPLVPPAPAPRSVPPPVTAPVVRPAVSTASPSRPHAPHTDNGDNFEDVFKVLGKSAPKGEGKPTKPAKTKARTSDKTAKRVVKVVKASRRAKAIVLMLAGLGLAANAVAQTPTGKVTKLSPDGFYQGLTGQATTLTGTRLSDVATVTFGEPGITAKVSSAAAGSLTATVSVPTTVQPGRYSVKAVNKDGSVVDTTDILLHVFTRDGALVGSYVEGRLASRLDAVEKQLTALDGRIGGLKKTLTADTTSLRTEINGQMASQNNRLATLATKAEVESKLSQSNTAIGEVRLAVELLDNRVSSTDQRLSQLEPGITAALDGAAAANDGLARLAGDRVPRRGPAGLVGATRTLDEELRDRHAAIAAALRQRLANPPK